LDASASLSAGFIPVTGGDSRLPKGQAGDGQVGKVTAADNGETFTEYDLLGHVQRTSGARVYPVAYHTSSLLTL